MIPLLLEIHSFGPFAGQETIDFQKLGTHKLFLIYGPTGAGKTTILDAMCYALYGTTSGDSRTGAHMRSEYASSKEPTRVSFTFAIGDKIYRAERSPKQEIAKKRGTGTKEAAATAALYQQEEDGSEKLLASKDVTAAVEALLGFKADQFRQVVLLPQGEFRRLLLANSTERQQIMQTLFHTQRYAQLEELARKRRDEVAGRYETIKAQREQLLNQLAVQQEEEVQARENILQAGKSKAETVLQQAETQVQQQQQALQAAKVVYSQYQTLQEAELAAAQLKEQEGTQQQRQEELSKLRKAQLLAEPCQQMDAIEAEGKAVADKLKLAKEQSKIAETAWGKTRTAAEALNKQKETYKDAAREAASLETIRPKVQAYAKAQRVSDTASKEAQKQTKIYQEITAQKDNIQVQLEKERNFLEQAAPWGVEAEKAKNRVQQLQEILQRKEEEAALQKKVRTVQKQLEAAASAYAGCEQAAHTENMKYEALQAVFLQSQASLLAMNLAEGEPCPVCGATHHLQLAVRPENVPQKEDVEKQKEIAAQAEEKRQKASLSVSQYQTQTAVLQKQYQEFLTRYTLTDSLDVYQMQLKQAEQAVKDWQAKLAAAAARKQVLQEQQRQLAGLEKEEAAAQQRADTAQQKALQSREQLRHLENELPPAYRQNDTLEKRLVQVRHFIKDYEEKEQQLQKEQLQRERERAQRQEEQKNWQQRVDTLHNRWYEAKENLRQRAEEAGFATVTECRERQKNIDRIPGLEAAIREYEARKQQLQGTILQTRKALSGKEEPELTRYEERLAAANQVYRQAAAEKARLELQYQQWQTAKKQLAKFQQQAAELTEEYKTAGGVYELISGRQTGVNFERYVLGALLDEVLQAANERLQQMSRQRYLLQRAKVREDKRSKSGLDLVVFDNYTGYERPANTLSGGETFLASLSLALGLADVVQAYSGGIHLDTIFIDEGFGTLDEETLDYALKTLMALKSGGRLVGIISHVSELKERIDARLSVKKTDRGSTTAFEFD